MNFMQAIESSGQNSLPSSSRSERRGGSVVAGWNEHVKPYAEESKFWDSVWTSLRKPNQGDIFERMKDSKRQYKYPVRRLKMVNDQPKNEKFLTSVIRGGADIFNEIRKFRGTSKTCSSRIDEEVDHSFCQHLLRTV